MLKKLAFVLVLILTLAAGSWAQEPTPKPQKIHWHKYINKEFRFSLRYPVCTDQLLTQSFAGTMITADGYFVWSDGKTQTRQLWLLSLYQGPFS